MIKSPAFTSFVLTAIFSAFLAAFVTFISAAEEPPAVREGSTVGVLTLDPPEVFVVVEEPGSGTRRLYRKEVYEAAGEEGLKPVKTVTLKELEYRYRPLKPGEKPGSAEFELIGLRDGRAVLFKPHDESMPVDIAPEPVYVEETTDNILQVTLEEEAGERQGSAAKRLVSPLFYKIKSERISETEWAVELPSLLEASANFAHVLGIVTQKVSELIEPGTPARIYFKSSLGRGRLGPGGLLIESLNTRLREKSGLGEGDLIKSVNGRSLSTLQDISAVSSVFTGGPKTAVVIFIRDGDDQEAEQEGEEVRHTYYIK